MSVPQMADLKVTLERISKEYIISTMNVFVLFHLADATLLCLDRSGDPLLITNEFIFLVSIISCC